MTDAAPFGYCPNCKTRRPLELDWTCCSCGTDARNQNTTQLGMCDVTNPAMVDAVDATVAGQEPSVEELLSLPAPPPGLGGDDPMYAITFDLDTKELANYAGNSPNYAYQAIGNFLKSRGFGWQQGSVYFGDATVDPVKAVLAVQALARAYPWFNSTVVRDIRMLRIEENNDLNPAIEYVESLRPHPTLDFGP